MSNPSSAIDGPRSLRPGEMPALRALEQKVFRPSMPDEYPQVFNEDNYDDLTVCFDGTRCVSHVGMVRRGASICGCRVDLGLIGGVATDPEYRGQGLAGLCCDHAFERAHQLGVDLLLVSGERSLYLRRDCVTVGQDFEFTIDADTATRLSVTVGALCLPRVQFVTMQESDLLAMSDLYRNEAVRFLRHADDYTDLYRCGIVLDQASDFLAIHTEGDTGQGFSAYAIVPKQAKSGSIAFLSEVGGDRRAVVAALPQILRRYNGVSLRLHVSRHDVSLHSLLTAAGADSIASPTSGTVRIVNFPQLMERLRPLWTETLGRRESGLLSFTEEGDTCLFHYGNETLSVGRGDAARLLFGTLSGEENDLLSHAGSGLTGALRAILPVPALWYGLSFV